jgi:hypothetical protein
MPESQWGDWLLFVPFIFTLVALLSVFGEIGDCLAQRHVWIGWVTLCE